MSSGLVRGKQDQILKYMHPSMFPCVYESAEFCITMFEMFNAPEINKNPLFLPPPVHLFIYRSSFPFLPESVRSASLSSINLSEHGLMPGCSRLSTLISSFSSILFVPVFLPVFTWSGSSWEDASSSSSHRWIQNSVKFSYKSEWEAVLSYNLLPVVFWETATLINKGFIKAQLSNDEATARVTFKQINLSVLQLRPADFTQARSDPEMKTFRINDITELMLIISGSDLDVSYKKTLICLQV